MAQEKLVKIAKALKKLENEKKSLEKRHTLALQRKTDLLNALSTQVASICFSSSSSTTAGECTEPEEMLLQKDQDDHYAAQASTDVIAAEVSALEKLHAVLASAVEKLASKQLDCNDLPAEINTTNKDYCFEYMGYKNASSNSIDNPETDDAQSGKESCSDKTDSMCFAESISEEVESLLKSNFIDEATATAVGIASKTFVKESCSAANVYKAYSFENGDPGEDFSHLSMLELEEKLKEVISVEVPEHQHLADQAQKELFSLAASLRSSLAGASRVRRLAPVVDVWYSYLKDLDRTAAREFQTRNVNNGSSSPSSTPRMISVQNGSAAGLPGTELEKLVQAETATRCEDLSRKDTRFPRCPKPQVKDTPTTISPEEVASNTTTSESEEQQQQLTSSVADLISACDQIISLARAETGEIL